MFKFLFNILTDPLGLPIPVIYEYIIIFIISLIAFKLAWDASPGGKYGSLIHWIVRLIATIVIWSITYLFIILIKLIISNWIIVLSLLAIIGTIILIKFIVLKNNET
ncbi:hypothetical protein [Fusibacter tunisiensis]|uniref:CHASE2 domain-containing sensor protein n=1 Tax=Fusibacter tunisiensis TaxID=1008308 RepID=A0ABS2MTK1_9FIRM|nr:hypothetical protein [Fusibacter tunisiensis]MBM7562768.1 CHASE2 domain-containing sensor protein [Fusibacter tunisiensis]